MEYRIRELRDATGLTQKAFAQRYRIPLSTLCKWEQGGASPPAYLLRLLAQTIPGTDSSLEVIRGSKKGVFYYDRNRCLVYDQLGNGVRVSENLDEVNRQNLIIYLEDLFEDFYEIQERFNRDCRYDKEEGILWTR